MTNGKYVAFRRIEDNMFWSGCDKKGTLLYGSSTLKIYPRDVAVKVMGSNQFLLKGHEVVILDVSVVGEPLIPQFELVPKDFNK